MQYFIYLFATFILYSFFGWLMESILSFIKTKKFINRGFLIGPYCPIYGIGCICLIFLLKKYSNDLMALFIIGTVICSIIEYLTSLILEKLFKTRWWDYSHLPFNINGRICLLYSVLFGLGGFIMLIVNPIIQNFMISIPKLLFNIIICIIIIFFIIDCIISFNIINKLKLATQEIYKDNTEEITQKISSVIHEKSKQFKRVIQAFPNAYTKNIYKKKFRK